jgi:hypothetical protein
MVVGAPGGGCCTLHGGQDAEKEEGWGSGIIFNVSPVTHFLQLGPTSQLHHLPK